MPYFTLYQGALRSDNCQNKPKPFILWEFGQAVLKIPHRILFPYFIFSTKSFPNNADKQTIHLPLSASPSPPFLGFMFSICCLVVPYFCLWLFLALSCAVQMELLFLWIYTTGNKQLLFQILFSSEVSASSFIWQGTTEHFIADNSLQACIVIWQK